MVLPKMQLSAYRASDEHVVCLSLGGHILAIVIHQGMAYAGIWLVRINVELFVRTQFEVNPQSWTLPLLFNKPSGTDLVIAVGLLNSTSRPIRLSKQERGDCCLVHRRLQHAC